MTFRNRYHRVASLTRPLREKLRKKVEPITLFPPEFSKSEKDFVNYVYTRRLTMVGPSRLFSVVTAVRHSIRHEVAGDFVECGVWRGGASLLAALLIRDLGSSLAVRMFDTFEGMSTPSDHDVEIQSGKRAAEFHSLKQLGTHNEWAYASLEEVKQHFSEAGIDEAQAIFVKGKVEDTLRIPANVPGRISTLRLDTDWFESTRVELEILYPRLGIGGALLLDDYGYWEGARRAVDEYFQGLGPKAPMLNIVDAEGRVAIKPG